MRAAALLARVFKAVESLLAALLLAMVLTVFGNVVLRFAFNSGIVVSGSSPASASSG
jgi:TRAP-type C4-dicarboxylate transport system permease small subunit